MDGPVILEELFPCVVAGVDAVDDRVDDVQRGVEAFLHVCACC